VWQLHVPPMTDTYGARRNMRFEAASDNGSTYFSLRLLLLLHG
jgi:hypothetical protein